MIYAKWFLDTRCNKSIISNYDENFGWSNYLKYTKRNFDVSSEGLPTNFPTKGLRSKRRSFFSYISGSYFTQSYRILLSPTTYTGTHCLWRKLHDIIDIKYISFYIYIILSDDFKILVLYHTTKPTFTFVCKWWII